MVQVSHLKGIRVVSKVYLEIVSHYVVLGRAHPGMDQNLTQNNATMVIIRFPLRIALRKIFKGLLPNEQLAAALHRARQALCNGLFGFA